MNTAALFLLLAAPLLSGQRSAEEILTEIDALTLPAYDEARMLTEGYAAEWKAACREVRAERAPRIAELWEVDPVHERLPDLLAERWEYLLREDPKVVLEETDAVLGFTELEEEDGVGFAPRKGVLDNAAYYHAAGAIAYHGPRREVQEMRTAIDRMVFLGTATSEERIDLMHLVLEFVGDLSLHEVPYKRLMRGADEDVVALARAMIKAADATDVQFTWTFENVTGKGRYSFQEQTGKLVVVEFWNTSDRECLERIPMLKRMRETYPQIELVGVSMDDRGTMRRSEFRARCEELGVDWPQFYQRWNELFFSDGWGVSRAPRTFLIGADGRLRRLWTGDDLEEILASYFF